MLQVNALNKSYGRRTVLKDVHFSVSPSQVVGLVGENGAGKSTLLEILATLTKPDDGTLSYKGLQYGKDEKKLRKQIGFVPQDIALWEDFSVKENMLFFEKLSWVKRNKQELRALLEEVKLDRWKEKVTQLSGGMRRKLNLAISLIHDPDLILLDEPTTGIDLKSSKEIGSYLHNQAKQANKTVVYTSHDMSEIMDICDQVFFIGEDPFYEEILTASGQEVVRLM
ncbi:MAG TPA: ABC transporter ATP-binding protein [Pseudogracilibacillus sp.]|nr:ABC transporter ATP-binding protein [Pseudogracilibacillus sp.]